MLAKLATTVKGKKIALYPYFTSITRDKVITDKLEVDVLTTKGCDLTGDRTRDLAHRRPRTNQLEIQVCINESKRWELDTNQISKPPSAEKE